MRTVTLREVRALREDVAAYPFGATSICTLRNLQVRPMGGAPLTLAIGPEDGLRSAARSKAGLPGLLFRKRRPKCRSCLRLIEPGQRIIRFEADFNEFGFGRHKGTIHANHEDCLAWRQKHVTLSREARD